MVWGSQQPTGNVKIPKGHTYYLSQPTSLSGGNSSVFTRKPKSRAKEAVRPHGPTRNGVCPIVDCILDWNSSVFLCSRHIGILAATVPPPGQDDIAQNLPPRLSSTEFGISTLCQNNGIALSTPLGGSLLQTSQSLPPTFWGIAVFACECCDSTDCEDQMNTCPERKTAPKRLSKKYIT